MELIVTNRDMVTANGTLDEPGGLTNLSSQRLDDVKASYWVGKLVDKVNGELRHLERERQKLVEEYAERNDKGEIVTIEGTNNIQLAHPVEFHTKFNELLDMKVTLDHVRPLTIEDLAGAKLSPIDMMHLGPFMGE